MTNRINMKKAILFDVDGALIHTLPELYKTTCEMWVELYAQPFPIDEKSFITERPNITTMVEYFSIIKRILIEIGYDEKIALPSELNQAFYKKRDERIKQDRSQWLSENTLYDGVPEMIAELHSMGIICSIVSSKNEDAIRELLKYHKILGYFNTIIGLENGKREQQFRLALEILDLEPQNTIAYDDASKNLIIAKKMQIIPLGAPQGYAKPGELDHFECAFISELPSVAKKIFGL
jgi:phosphoglycolate phosphatase-like HAD superfamily hydrolase